MKHIKRALRMYRVFAAQELKRMMEYKADFIIGIVGFLLLQVSNLLFLWLIFRQVPDLMGWSVNEIVFIYGFSLLPKGLDHLLFDNLWAIGHYIVRKGEFDKYLTRPVNTLFHVMVEKFQTEALGELVVGAALVAVTLPQLNVSWSVEKVVLILVVIPFAATIYTAVKTITASVAFWSKRSGNIIFMFYMVCDFAKYPVTIYNRVVRDVITYFIPFALTAYYPAVFLLRSENPLFCIGMPVLAAVTLMAIGIFVWHKGTQAYESAGS